jgi:hypothetical protein
MKRLLINLFLSFCVLTAPHMSVANVSKAQEVEQKEHAKKADNKKRLNAFEQLVCVMALGITAILVIGVVCAHKDSHSQLHERSDHAHDKKDAQQDPSINAQAS